MRGAALLLLVAGSAAVSGCVAAVVPVAAGGVIAAKKAGEYQRSVRAGETRADRRARRRGRADAQGGAPAQLPALEAAEQALPGQVYRGFLPPPSGAPATPPPSAGSATAVVGGVAPAPVRRPDGAGEAAIASLQTYLMLNDWIVARATSKVVGEKMQSVVLAPDAKLEEPHFAACGDKPLAVVLDLDDTAMLDGDVAADTLAAAPGVSEARTVAKAMQVAFVYNSARSPADAPRIAAALERLGLGPAEPGVTLWLRGDAGGSGKDSVRQAIAAKYCVIGLVGDQLGDFSDRFDEAALSPAARGSLASSRAIKAMWGHGWFMLPNPVYPAESDHVAAEAPVVGKTDQP